MSKFIEKFDGGYGVDTDFNADCLSPEDLAAHIIETIKCVDEHNECFLLNDTEASIHSLRRIQGQLTLVTQEENGTESHNPIATAADYINFVLVGGLE